NEKANIEANSAMMRNLFVALTGERFDAHNFLEQARDAGASAAVVREGTSPVSRLPLITVPNTLTALGRLGAYRRRLVPGPVVAITGTAGKTSTREMLAAVLGSRWRVHATHGNRNNEVGVPLTLLAAPDDAEVLVIEAGASVPGEIARLRDIIQPDLAVVTNVSAGHVEGFGSVEGALAEKVALLAGVAEAVVGPDPAALAERARAVARHVTVAGLDVPCDVRPDAWQVGPDARATLTVGDVSVTLPLVGRHQAANAMLAVAVGKVLGVPVAQALKQLDAVRLPAGRVEVRQAGGRTILHDAYNSNPASLAAALETVQALRDSRPLVLVVGSMLELGAMQQTEHERLARMMVAMRPALVGAEGAFATALASVGDLGDRLVTAADADQLGAALAGRVPPDAVILIKGSRGTRMERVLPYLTSGT
ncbi:MAG: UDP-N-acetylmuramoyl-tripeptide--D-alanyl-D-alanine ligase, partial [Gemmatimonadales bacterium]